MFKEVGTIFDLNAVHVFPSGETTTQFRTIMIFSTTVTGLFMLWKIVQPLNMFRTSLMILMTVLIAIVAWFGRDILEIGDVHTENVLLLIIMMQASYPLIAFIEAILSKIRLDKVPILNKINEKLDR